MVDASLLLFTSLQPQMNSTRKNYVEMLKASISLVLFAAAQLLTVYSKANEQQEATEKVRTVLHRLQDMLWKWITNSKVIGGSIFGGSVKSWKAKEEIEVSVMPHLL